MKIKKALILFALLLTASLLGKTVHIFSDYVKPEKDRAFYQGNVLVEIDEDNLKLSCPTMTISKYQQEWRLVEATGTTYMEFDGGSATSTALNYDLKTTQGELLQGVTAEIFDQESTDTVFLTCDSLKIDLSKDLFEGYSEQKVWIVKGSIEATAENFTYDREAGIIELSGSVQLVDNDKNITISADSVTIKTENDEMTATKAEVEIVVEE